MVVCARPLFPHCGVHVHEIWFVSCVYIWARTSVSVSVGVGEGVLILVWVCIIRAEDHIIIAFVVVFCCCYYDCFLVNDCSYQIVFRFLIESRFSDAENSAVFLRVFACQRLRVCHCVFEQSSENGLPPSILDFQLNDGRMKHTQNTHTHRGRRRRKGKRFTARKECFWVSFFYFHLFDLSLSFFFPQPAKGEKIYSSQGMFLGIFLSPWIEGHSVERAHMYGSFHKKAPHYLRHLWLDFGGSFVWMLWKDPHNRDLLLHFMDRSTRKHVVERSIY